jgi:hypothetical protein
MATFRPGVAIFGSGYAGLLPQMTMNSTGVVVFGLVSYFWPEALSFMTTRQEDRCRLWHSGYNTLSILTTYYSSFAPKFHDR